MSQKAASVVQRKAWRTIVKDHFRMIFILAHKAEHIYKMT